MGFTTPQRWSVFLTGFAVGCVIVTIAFHNHRWPHAPVPPPPGIIRHEVPGIFVELMRPGTPIEGDFIISDSYGKMAADGTRLRDFVVRGLDAGAFIRVEEQWAPTKPGDEPKVLSWKYMMADRVRVKLQPQADTPAMAAAPHAKGWQFLDRDAATGTVGILLNAHEAKSVADALTQLQAWPQWVASAEPDIIPASEMGGQPQ